MSDTSKQASTMGPQEVARLIFDVIQGVCVTHREVRPEKLREFGAPADVIRAYLDIEGTFEDHYAEEEGRLASVSPGDPAMSQDRVLRAAIIRLAHEHPEFRKDLLPLVREAAEFPADSIGEKVPGPQGIPGSDAQKPWAKGEFTQQENSQLLSEQDAGKLSDGKADPVGKKAGEGGVPFPAEMKQDADPKSKDQNKPETWNNVPPKGVQASDEAALRSNLIRLAHAQPQFRKDILQLLAE